MSGRRCKALARQYREKHDGRDIARRGEFYRGYTVKLSDWRRLKKAYLRERRCRT